ncbi:MAG TPA: 30S ribosomal protein S1 [Bacteroidales bacterium]|jgi:small subunit ribosomal protein S1|nr:MAG: 30S ribosomal protein S1 [Bacteroidetes bacterium ADurb.Bin145]HOU03317.1 30S ribosomal protein S1 [Bacteroidales bacterium]HQG63975.1 30S ribosomal protein S1 [Bacteroidales bacterium]HQK66987.1 30S ribosomal protein S1 [Bacteroidales bacterium]
MSESKKKTTKKEVVEKNTEDVVKPVRKIKVKETKEKLIEEALEEIEIPEQEVTEVRAKAPKKVEDKPEVSLETPESVSDFSVETGSVEADSAESKPKKVRSEKTADTRPQINVTTANEDFDWSAFESDELKNSPKHKEYEAMYDETLSTVAVDEVVQGTVIQMTSREVVINIGYKSEGVVSLNEFRYNPNLKVGDKVEVYVESQEDKKGQLLLSHKKARAINSWDRVNASLEKDEIITGYIKCRTKGGMIVDVFGIEAFLPGSQIDVKPIRDYDVFVGKTMEFKVVKINQEFKNVVVSHKALIEAELEQQKKEIIAKLEKGQVLEGTVKNITSYGVFIDLGGVDGLIHITDLSWGRVNHPEEIVQLDQKLNVVILDFDDDKKRIALGLKQLTPHPWDSVDPNLKIGDKVKGKVVVMADYGAFVEIAPGVEGLIHVSEMSWSQHLRSAQEFMKVGDEVEAVILTLDRSERKMSLGIKQLKPDPWQNIEEKYTVGSKHKARVRNFTNFGVFVEIEEGVDGLIHISDLSWTKKIKHPAEFTSIDAEIEVVVLEIDKENRRLSLGHKQLEENPWDVFETLFTIDSIHEGTVMEVFDKGAIVALPYGVEGFATPKHLVKEDGTVAKVDEKLMFKVIEFNKSAKKIIISHSRIYEDEKKAVEAPVKKAEAESPKRSSRKSKSNMEKTTLGDITQLAALKEEMEEKENKATKK